MTDGLSNAQNSVKKSRDLFINDLNEGTFLYGEFAKSKKTLIN